MPSTWTIPTDPGFQTRRPNSAQRYEPAIDGSRPKPRVKPEALSNAIKGQGSLALLFNPTSKPYTLLSRPGSAQQKDFKKENAYHIKQIQRANRKKQQESAAGEPVKAVYKPDKFDHVESKVAQECKAPPPAPRSNSASFLRAHSRNGPPVKDRPSSAEPVVPKECKLTIPKASNAREGSPPKKNRNHIAENIRRTASSPGPKRAPSALAMEELKLKKKDEQEKYKRGSVPKYLKQRQKQWKKEEEIRIANTPDPTVPAGHVLMPRDERLQTLDALQKNQDELLVELRSLPVRADTLRVRTRKAELERKLSEIESAIKIFSRPKVFVKVDE
ncbi:enkurin domain-containing protein 1 [Exaiptasia diaphana]|uniref:Enkurin domain-containing protein n=1 Tax=Exaiptasia diaphana TaxID=2652724 RepID=A0A913WZK4_EXADI|nr:enkurin domain-containing protein 1 [Exaiptasia diaphana]KXJ16482.1 Enkurin domain-containing protein 1 [Exaiptasia diaphana]